jgi:hypothetical protein
MKEVWTSENAHCRGRYNGQSAEESFSAICLRKGWHLYAPKVDEGVDFIVETENGGMKKVQITRCSQHQYGEGAQVVGKKINKLRKDVDVLAILYERNVDWGIEQSWFIMPTSCYVSVKFNLYYNNLANFYINLQKLKPPLDIALNAWWLFDKKNISGKRIRKAFYCL